MNPPYRVLVTIGRSRKSKVWLHWHEPLSHFLDARGRWFKASDLTVVDHPKNDHEGTEIIEQAKTTRKPASTKARDKTRSKTL